MKFLPEKFRETQDDWFGKRVFSWHISVIVRKVKGDLQHQTLVHKAKSSPQESDTVMWIMEHLLATLKKEHPEKTTAYRPILSDVIVYVCPRGTPRLGGKRTSMYTYVLNPARVIVRKFLLF